MRPQNDQRIFPHRIAVVASAEGSELAVSLRSAANVCIALRESFPAVETFPFNIDLASALKQWCPDMVFPVAHGPGESGNLQRLLGDLRFAFVGSDETSSALCWDKARANLAIASQLQAIETKESGPMSVVVPAFVTLRRGADVRKLVVSYCRDHPDGGALVVKPAREGSSIGIRFCVHPAKKTLSRDEVLLAGNASLFDSRIDRIIEAADQAFAFFDLVLLQIAVSGVEITVGVIEDPNPVALPVVEILTPAGSWYDYKRKYESGASEHVVPARVPEVWLWNAQAAATWIHRLLGCRDWYRTDFILGKTGPVADFGPFYFLETNTQPGMTDQSLYPEGAKAAGQSMATLTRKLVMRTWSRH